MRRLNLSKNLTDDVKISKYITQTDSSDIRIFNNMLASHDKLQKTHNTGSEVYPLFPELHQDLFNAFFKYKPNFNAPGNIDLNYFLNESIMKTVVSLDKYKEARNVTKLDPLASAVGMEYIGEEVFKLIQDVEEKNKELLEKIRAANEGILDLENQAKGDLPENELNKLHMKYEDAQKLLEEYKQQLHETIQKEKKSTLNRIVEQATKSIKEVDDIISSWGLGYSPTFTNTGYQEKIKLLDRLRSTKLKAITNLLGRYKQMALRAQREKVKKGLNEIFDVVQGKDLKKALPAELAKLGNPLLKPLFLKDYAEGKMLQYKYETKEKKQKGPIIICVDNSGSMSGTPEIWSKTVALGMLEIARLQKRSCFIIHFDSGPKESLPTYEFLRKVPFDLNKALDMCDYFSGGGTYFEPPLNLARDKVSEDGNFEKADIVFITDGKLNLTL